MKWGSILFVSLLVLFGCIENLNELPPQKSRLVISGSVSNDTTAYAVRVFRTTTFNVPNIYILDAEVKIKDDLGTEVLLTHDSFGIYYTPIEYYGIPGRSYWVEVLLSDGNLYKSIPEEMIDTQGSLVDMNYKANQTSIELYVDYDEPMEERNFYRWRYGGVYEVIAPWAQSLAEVELEDDTIFACFPQWDHTPFKEISVCYTRDFDNELLQVSDDILTNGQFIDDFLIAEIPVTRQFDRGYYLFAKQYHISERTYRYWKAILNQLGNSGSIFESANYNIRGNMINTSDPNEDVQGYFEVSSVTSMGKFVQNYMGTFILEDQCFPQGPTCPAYKCFDCRLIAPSASNIKPHYWPF